MCKRSWYQYAWWFEIIDPELSDKRHEYAKNLYKKRKRRGVSQMLAEEYVSTQHYFATMMLDCGDVDALISGTRSSYKMAIKPLLQVIGVKKDMALLGCI